MHTIRHNKTNKQTSNPTINKFAKWLANKRASKQTTNKQASKQTNNQAHKQAAHKQNKLNKQTN